ncbi:WD40-repeat-containing domain protein [Trametes meyenii]|nr:WD40-repeat-containing domain protein [Trametes meyenii]
MPCDEFGTAVSAGLAICTTMKECGLADPDGTYLATGGMDGKLCLWYLETGELAHQYKTATSSVLSLAWTEVAPDTILCGLQNGSVALFRVTPTKLLVHGFWAHRYPVECLAVSGTRLATGGHREIAVWKWNATDQKYDRELDLEEPPKTSQNESEPIIVTSLHWTSSDKHACLLFVTYMNHGVHVLDATNWTSLRAVALNGRIASASVTPDGKMYAVSNVSRGFDVYYMTSDAPFCSFSHKVGVPSPVPVLFIHGGRALMGGSTVGEVDIWAVDLKHKMHSLHLRHPCKDAFHVR